MPSGFNLRQKDISVGSGLNIEYSSTGAGVILSVPPVESRADETFTASSLNENNKLVINDCSVGTFIILDENKQLQEPDVFQVDNNVEIDFTGWTISGIWTIKFITVILQPTISVDRNNPVEFTVLDEDYGRCVWLYDTTPTMTFANPVYNATKIRLLCVSGDSTVSGSVVLTPIIGGTAKDSVTIAVGTTPQWVELSLGNVSGTLTIMRDTSSTDDTLNGEGSVVALVVLSSEIYYA